MVRSIDHIVIAVRDLAQASADYAGAGFTVTPGGEHTGGATHNALISFGDGTYFELIAFKDTSQLSDHRWASLLAKGEGTVAFALLSGGLTAEAERLKEAGWETSPRDGGRLRPDGQRIAWKSVSLEREGTALPFLIEDLTPRVLRVPDGAAEIHPLGATQVAGVTVAVADLAKSAPVYEALLAAAGTPSQPEIAGVKAAVRFALGAQWIELAQPDDSASDLRQHLEARADGPFEVVLSGVEEKGLLPVAATHGARVRVAVGG